MALAITIQGIDEALSHFNYQNRPALKYRLIGLIRGHYEDEAAVETVQGIDADELIKILWDTGDDPTAVKNRRKNLKSVKSAINNELKKLYEEGKNPEGVTIGPENTFVMSDEARNNALEAFIREPKEDGTAIVGQVKDVLKVLNEVLSNSPYFNDTGEEDDPGGLQEIKALIRELTEKAGLSEVELIRADAGVSHSRPAGEDQTGTADGGDVPGGGTGQVGPGGTAGGDGRGVEGGGSGAGGSETQGQPEEVEEISPGEELEEVEGDEVEEVLEEVDEAEDVDDAEAAGEELEEVEGDEVEEVLEEGDEAGDAEDAEGVDEDLEEIEGDEVEELLEEIDGAEDAEDAEGVDEDLEEVEGDEVEEVLEEVDEEDAEDAEEIDEGLEAVEELEDVEEIDLDEDLDEIGEDEVDDLLEEVDGEGLGDGAGPVEGGPDDSHPGKTDGVVGRENDARLLAEKFNEALAARDKFYNQYLLIPKGTFTIGSGISGKGRNIERMVNLPSFYMGKSPVTNALFEIFVEETGYQTTAEKVGHGTVFNGRHFGRKTAQTDASATFSCNSALSVKVVKGACWYQPFGPGSTLYGKRNHPVVQVSLEDAKAFAAWTGKRLPTEEEWEAAARTSSGHLFPWGDEWVENGCNVEESLIGDTTPIDSYGAFENSYGLADTLGNVLEWTVTLSKEPDRGKGGSGVYVTKGGSFISGNGIRLSDRTVLQAQYHSNILGFRCVAY